MKSSCKFDDCCKCSLNMIVWWRCSYYKCWWWYICNDMMHTFDKIDGLMQERRNSSALAMELHLSCINPPIWFQYYHISLGPMSQVNLRVSRLQCWPRDMPGLHLCCTGMFLLQAACIWLLSVARRCSKHPYVQKRFTSIQQAFMHLLADSDGKFSCRNPELNPTS